ncbi:uncharacterized protein LOC132738176 [Ruditapes philippinarum]|uniref:uncharacterized protein LOC132738176 n=1 Tax=Ruditapes philippinarum TaxID=129788 RepID=UPI00295ADCEE|nr:uncharacterized protein LOC132738176 [Ruditapes philippinarum]
MYHINDYSHNISMRLSEVLDDIGVNETMVMKRRKIFMLMETMHTIQYSLNDRNDTIFYPGSQSEGSTTLGLQSDVDMLFCFNDVNVIQDWADWKQGKLNLLMIQDNNTTPGYCSLQQLEFDVPIPATDVRDKYHIKDINGRVLLTNDLLENGIPEGNQQHGPSIASQAEDGFYARDYVPALTCVSWPRSALNWLQHQESDSWPTQEIKQYAISSSCFVVPVGSKVSMNPQIEWRISTTLAERCLMFNLNITQLRCYVLMKMIVKSYLNLNGENNLSSFMCKSVILHCVKNIESKMWKECNLIQCLTICLLQLYNCLQKEECPHFIIKENNLMAGQFTADEKYNILQTINLLVQRGGLGLLGIKIDDVGQRLKIKLNIIPQVIHYPPSKLDISKYVSAGLYLNFSKSKTEFVTHILNNTESLSICIQRLMKYNKEGNKLDQSACRFLAPRFLTTLGSMLASSSIGQYGSISHQALTWFSTGLKSNDVADRLKLASMFYCTGDFGRTEITLRNIAQEFNNDVIVPLCGCYDNRPPKLNPDFLETCNDQNESSIQHYIAHCVQFLQSEINCVPPELQFEMFRSTQDDLLHHRNDEEDYWMNWAVVDSLPFFHVLQYKVYSRLQKHQDQQQALHDLIWIIDTNKNLRHKETDLNLLGQLMEQANRPQDALQCYMMSLQIRSRNNAARFHV